MNPIVVLIGLINASATPAVGYLSTIEIPTEGGNQQGPSTPVQNPCPPAPLAGERMSKFLARWPGGLPIPSLPSAGGELKWDPWFGWQTGNCVPGAWTPWEAPFTSPPALAT